MSYFKEVINDLSSDTEISKFIQENKLTEEDIINNLGLLISQKENNEICRRSPDKCLSDPAGMASRITYDQGRVIQTYYQVKAVGDNIERLFFPSKDEVQEKELYMNQARAEVIREYMRIRKNYSKRKGIKGVYIHGKFGTGKSFILQKLAIDLGNLGASVLIAYYPDLVRTIKSSITSRSTEVIINKLKNIDILMLDDIGAETNTNFIRDEVLGPILQYRIDSELLVCMTSNLDLKELRAHFQDSTTSSNLINSERIISRIRSLMVDVSLDDINFRDRT